MKRLVPLTLQATVALIATSSFFPFRNLEGEPLEKYNNPPAAACQLEFSPGMISQYGGYTSYQVNVSANGQNIMGDAANEPSISVNPTDRNRMAIGWRQFDCVSSDFRTAGYAYTTDGGITWIKDALQNNVFRSDPVLGADDGGKFFYFSAFTQYHPPTPQPIFDDIWRSTNGGQSWAQLSVPTGGDKEWFTIDKSNSSGHGFQYQFWNVCTEGQPDCYYGNRNFSRSTDGGLTWQEPIAMPHSPIFGTLDVDTSGNLFLCGVSSECDPHWCVWCLRSTDAKNAAATPSFQQTTPAPIDLGGDLLVGSQLIPSPSINPWGLSGQVFLAVDRSGTSTNNNIYMVGSVQPSGFGGSEVMFVRSTNGGQSFSSPFRINDDSNHQGKWHWFGTLSVAPNGRIDIVWFDTRNAADNRHSQLFYRSSANGGVTWTANIAVSNSFDPAVGYPGNPAQQKMGDYITVVSDNGGANVAYCATFSTEQGEEDIYYVRIPAMDPNPSSNLPNLAPYQPSGWSGAIVVSNVAGATTDSAGLSPNDNLYIDWAIHNNGVVATTTSFVTQLYVDNIFREAWTTSGTFQPNTYVPVIGYPIGSLPLGQHQLKIKTDSANSIVESNETDNEYAKTITIGAPTPTPVPTATPTPSATPEPKILALSTHSFSVGTGSGGANFLIYNRGSGVLNWTASANVSWISMAGANGTAGSNGTPLSFSHEQNSSSSQRSGIITVSSPGAAGNPQTVVVTQAGLNGASVNIYDINSPITGTAGQNLTVTCGVSSPTSQSVMMEVSLYPTGQSATHYDVPGVSPMVLSASTSQSAGTAFPLPSDLPAGTYDVEASIWADSNSDAVLDPGDTLLGIFRKNGILTVAAAPTPSPTPTPTPMPIPTPGPFAEHLDFNDNKVPPGWAITFPYGVNTDASIANQRFEIRTGYTYGALEKVKAIPTGATAARIAFRCDVENFPEGEIYEIQFLTQDGELYHVDLLTTTFNTLQTRIGTQPVNSYVHTLPPYYGAYTLEAIFRDGQISFTATKDGSSTPLDAQTMAIPTLKITQLSKIRLLGIMTTGGPAWIDDADLSLVGDPLDPSLIPTVIGQRYSSSAGFTVSWSAKAGHTYQVQRSADLGFTSFDVIEAGIPGIEPVTSFTDSSPAVLSASRMFYRVGLER